MFSLSFLKPPGHTSFALHLVKKLWPLQYDVLCCAWNWRTRTDRSKSEQQQSAILPCSQKWHEAFRVSVLLFASTLNPQTLAFVNPQPSVPLCVRLSLSWQWRRRCWDHFRWLKDVRPVFSSQWRIACSHYGRWAESGWFNLIPVPPRLCICSYTVGDEARDGAFRAVKAKATP
jgi:hypothetical protein